MILITDDVAVGAHLKPIFDEVQICTVQCLTEAVRRSPVHLFIACYGSLGKAASFEAFATALSHHRTQPSIPVLFLVCEENEESADRAAILGATETISATASADSLIAAARRCIRGKIEASHFVRNQDDGLRGSVDAVGRCFSKLFEAAGRRQTIAASFLSSSADVLMASVKQARLSDWINIVRKHDDATYQHCLLVAGLAAAFTARLGYTLDKQNLLSQAALVHDLGKAHVPRAILSKPGALTAAELSVIRTHPSAGHALLSKGGHDPIVLDVVLKHHELLDGSGYPGALKRGQISEPVRVITICDIFAALIERRPYKAPMSRDESRSHLHSMIGKLDSCLLAAFDTVIQAV